MNESENLAVLLREFASQLMAADSTLSYNAAPLQIQNLVPVLRRLGDKALPISEWESYAGEEVARRDARSSGDTGMRLVRLCRAVGLVDFEEPEGTVRLSQVQELPLVPSGAELLEVLDELGPHVADAFFAYAPEAADLAYAVGFTSSVTRGELAQRFDGRWLFRHKMNSAILDTLRVNLCRLRYWSEDRGNAAASRFAEQLDPRGNGSPRLAAMMLLTAWAEVLLSSPDPTSPPTTDDLIRLLDHQDLRPGQVREWAARLFTGAGPLSHLFHGQGSREIWELHLTVDSLRTLLSGRLVAWDRLLPALQRLAAAAGAAALVEAAQDAARCLHAHIRETGATPPDTLDRWVGHRDRPSSTSTSSSNT